MAWYDPTTWFSDSGYNDAGLEALINANDLANSQFGNDYTQYQTFSDLPDYYDQYYSPASSSTFGGMGFKDLASLGLGGLSLYGNWKASQDANDLKRDELAVVEEDKRLRSADDFAKMHALSQIIQARQGINLDPSLAYAEAMRKQMGLSPEGATEFAGVDIGGPMQTGLSSADRLDLINQATNVNFAEGGGVWGGGLARLLASRSPQLAAARQAQEQRQQNAAGFGMNENPFLAKMLQPLRARLMERQQQSAMEQPRRFGGGLSSFIARSPQFMAAIQQRGVLPQTGMAAGGDVQGWLAGDSSGQADDVNASLSHGEYVFDADTVAALGDGNTEAGAKELDRMRKAIRQHKRSAPASKIPPPSKGALAYLKGVK